MRKSEINVNTFWQYVKSKFPDARFCYWYDDGNLTFYPNGRSELDDRNLSVCYRNDRAQLAISVGDHWR